MSSESSVDLVGREAAYLSIVEIGLGSLLHAFRVPLAGVFLSINQGFFLSRALAQAARGGMPRARIIPAEISAVAAILKSLSPAGKKLTPMMAISMQGLLFTLGALVAGVGVAGAVLGSVLASVWAFVQPWLIYRLLYGQTLEQVAAYYQDKFGLVDWIVALVVLKAVVSGVLGVAGYVMSDARFERYRERLSAVGSRGPRRVEATWAESVRGALRELASPLFLVPLVMTALFLAYSQTEASQVVWVLLRPLAVGFLLLLVMRRLPVDAVSRRLGGTRLRGLGRSVDAALSLLRRPGN